MAAGGMPQGIKEAMEALKTKLGKPKLIEEGKEIKISKICFDDTGTSAFKEITQPVKERSWKNSMMRRGMQPTEEEQQETSEDEEEEPPIDHKNFMAFDCNIANPLTKKAMRCI